MGYVVTATYDEKNKGQIQTFTEGPFAALGTVQDFLSDSRFRDNPIQIQFSSWEEFQNGKRSG